MLLISRAACEVAILYLVERYNKIYCRYTGYDNAIRGMLNPCQRGITEYTVGIQDMIMQ